MSGKQCPLQSLEVVTQKKEHITGYCNAVCYLTTRVMC